MAKPCSTCNGEGKLDSVNKKPWSQADRKSVLAGEVLTENCGDCGGSGEAKETSKPSK
jgi:DnaJ-class molecular chaperone